MDKKAQVTVFLIIALLILTLLSYFVYIKNISKSTEPEVKKALDISKIPLEVKNYVESCINIVGEPLIEDIAKKGGSLNPKSGIYYNDEELNVFCTEEKDKGCVNNFVSRENIEKELSAKIKNKLETCIDFNEFEKQGLEITAGTINANASIGKDDVLVNVHYPVGLSLGDSKINIEDF